jgi:hypothetical protein
MPNLAHLVPARPLAYHRSEISSSLRALCTASELYWNAMSAEEFARPLGGAWSPADNVRHLTKSVRAVSRGMKAPTLVLRLLFGWNRRRSRVMDVLVEEYQRALRGGGQAGRFAPRRRAVPTDLEAYRRDILAAHRSSVAQLALQTLDWSRRRIDSVRLPHPLLGKLTVREMLLFTIYHNLHHVQVVARRRGELTGGATPLAGG